MVILLLLLVSAIQGELIPLARAATPSQGLLREIYTGISGLTVADLTNSARFPNNPTSTNYLTDFEAPIDIGEQYGQRVRGYVVPPTTGNYTFWISSDDGSTLYLSTDESPANKRVIASVATWTTPRQWDKEANQTSAAIRLESGRKYYVEALMKEEGGGDNLAVRWQLPDGKMEEPIPAARLIPFGVSFTPPVITEHPANTTAVENDAATFRVRVSNLDPVSYQWRKNDVNIPGANGSAYTHQPVVLADHGARFRCFLTNSLGTALSDEAILAVTPDVIPPLISSVLNSGSNSVTIVFSEAVGLAGATSSANYAIDQSISVLAAVLSSDTRTVILTTTLMTYGTAYTLTVHDIQDRAAAPNTVAAGLQKTFLAVEFVPSDIGNPAQAGSATPVGNGFNVVGGGSDIGGIFDQFHFEYQKRSGNFDVKVRVQSLGASDAWAKAGVMARESLEANSRFAASLTTPATVGCFFQSRTATGAAASAAGYFPVNFPETWLRLQRSGNLFTGYASLDGQNWTVLGSVNMSMPGTVYLGQAVTSRNPVQTTLAEFRDFGTVSGGVIGDFIPAREPLGTSSRRTGLVISEIMYHPKARADSNNLEFVEVFNAGLILEDLTGHRLSGALDCQFPDGTILPAGGFLVVARVPADVQRIYGLSQVFGPYTNSLQNSSGTIRLRDRADAVKLEASYSGVPPWPAAADGAGHSLVLARPSYGESSVLAWAASELIGGSPGTFDAIRPNPQAAVMINEFLAHTDDPQLDFIELYNHSSQTVDISGCFLTEERGTNKFMIAADTRIAARGFVSFDQNQFGFALNAGGETIYLVNSNQTRVLDSVRFEGQANGVSSGRYPDGAPGFRPLANPSASGPNAPWLIPAVVINEIMYNPISGNNNDEYIELYNRGSTAVDLSGWKFTDGIEFEFPTNTVMAPDGYLVIAQDAARLVLNYANLNSANTLGDYQGNLSNSGERLALSKPDLVVTTNEFEVVQTNVIHIVVEEVTYGEGGRWGKWADGGGSSLERIDPHSDPWRASNWADSDETAKAPWSTIEFTGVLDNGNTGYPPNSFQMHLLGAGECLVDDVEVVRLGSTNLISNSAFETGTTGWFIQGNHRTTSLENSGGFNGGKCLHVRTTGRGDTGANRIRSTLSNTTALRSGNTATLRAKVRWLTGHPEFLLRLRGNWLEAAGPMAVPANLGTPGTRNSRAVANAGPAIFDVSHSPILPTANQAVVVTSRVSDPDGLAQVVLKYRVDPSSTLSTLTMVDNGTGGDAVAGDGVYSATITGRPAATLIAFHIQATDALSPGATSKFPSDAVKSECLVRWGESQPLGNLGVYRFWQTQANLNTFSSRESLANDPLDATFVYGNYRVIYNFGVRAKGSPFHGGSVGADYLFAFPDDDVFWGARDMPLVTVGNLGNDDTAQREQAAYWIGKELGIPYLYRRFVQFYVNGNRKGSVYEDTEEPNGQFIAGWFPDDAEGDLHKIEDWFEFDDNASGFSNVDATLQKFTTTGGVLKLARYRWDWRKRAVQDSASNYTNLFNLVNAVNLADSTYTAQVENLVDLEQWMRNFALQHMVGNWDAYGYSRGKNMYAYKPINGKWALMAWDIDFVLGLSSDGPSSDVFGANDPTVTRMYSHPPFQRAYWRAFQDAVNGPLRNERIDPIMDARCQGLRANGITVTDPAAIKTWIASRRNYLLSRLNSLNANFAITSNNGNNFSTNKSTATLTGTAPIAVKTIEINGVAYPVTWTGVTTWSLSLPLAGRTNSLTFQGYDLRGKPIAGVSDTITVTFTGTSQQPENYLVINEIMYNPVTPETAFIEIHNTSTVSAFDLSNFRLEGVGFTFPEGVVLNANNYLVVAKNRTEFAKAYGLTVLPVGEFPGQLDNGGETLRLVRPGATPEEDTLIDEVRFDDDPPWPALADGKGPSLQLIDPFQDNYRAGNWTTVATNAVKLATPGGANTPRASIPAFPPVWLNEVLPNNISGLTDHQNDLDPWIELYNSGASQVSLNGHFLTASYTNLTQWPFPTNAVLQPGEFLVIWADGEPIESATNEFHTNFRLLPSSGSVALTRLQNGLPAVMDHLNYTLISAGRSHGSFPDGQPRDRQVFHYSTPGGTNSNVAIPISVFINEWMADNTRSYADPADGQFEDWFELYNAGANEVDLTGYRLTDTLTNTAKFVIPAGTIIPPEGFLLVWADEESGQTGRTNQDLHVNFKLSQTGEAIGLFAPDGTTVDAITFGAQTNDISEGRWPDGALDPFVFMSIPTPRAANMISTNNSPPVVPAIADQTIDEEAELRLTVMASDPNEGQTLTFSFGPGAPAGAGIDASTGLFTWTPGEAQGPGSYLVTIRVADDGSPKLTRSQRFTIHVKDVNTAPVLAPIDDVTIHEEEPLFFAVAASDKDLPAQALRFSLDPGAPAGAAIDPVTGAFGWTPTEAQGPGIYSVTIRVTDDSLPILSDAKAVTIAVKEVNFAPRLAPIGHKRVTEGDTLNFTASASDIDEPVQKLTFSLDPGAPEGAVIDPVNRVFTWTPTQAQIPSTSAVTIRVTDDGSPPLSNAETITILASKTNQPPVLRAIENKTGEERAALIFTVQANDPDVPLQTLTFTLEPGAPAGASINPTNGAFIWTPSENQGPSTNVITVTVADDGLPSLSDTKSFTITISELNDPPSIAEIAAQSVDEESTLSLTINASDPDQPPSSLIYSLEPGAPTGAAIDSASGLFTWTPTEAQGPGTNVITVRVAENNEAALSSTITFGVAVNEVNAPPTLAAIADQVLLEGSTLILTNSAGDRDLPVQKLTFSLAPGAPPGAFVDPLTGVLTWATADDEGTRTNTITLRVTDDGSPPLSESRSLTVVIRAKMRLVINEIMHSPAVANAEFIELLNTSTNSPADLSGFRLTGEHLTYVFPQGANVGPGNYLVIAKNQGVFSATYGNAIPVVGEFSGAFSPNGDTLRLIKPGAVPEEDELIDEVTFSNRPPWPTPASGQGASLQLIDSRQDSDRIANWAGVTGIATNQPLSLIVITNVWRYNQAGVDLGTAWKETNYNDAFWPTNRSLFYVETAPLPAPTNTPLTLGRTTYYFRTTFNFNANPAGATVRISAVLDDGAVIYLNGRELIRPGMAEGTVTNATFANRTVADAVYEGPYVLSAPSLRQGLNVLAVEVHQVNSGSSDIVFGMTLDVEGVRLAAYTPGEANSVRASLPLFPPLWLNEVLPANNSSPTDRLGDHDPWIELYHAGAIPISLNGYYLTDNYTNLLKWAFPTNAVINPGQFLLLWADNEPGESTSDEFHAGFRLSPTNGSLALVRIQNSQPEIVDYLDYSLPEPDTALGSFPDGQPKSRRIFRPPTPLAQNQSALADLGLARISLNGAGTVTLTWSSLAGRTYRLLYRKDLIGQSGWLTDGEVTAAGSATSFTTSANDGEKRFFRVELLR